MSVILRAEENARDEKKTSRLERLRVLSGPYLSEGDVIFAPPGYQRPTKYRESERRFDGNR